MYMYTARSTYFGLFIHLFINGRKYVNLVSKLIPLLSLILPYRIVKFILVVYTP